MKRARIIALAAAAVLMAGGAALWPRIDGTLPDAAPRASLETALPQERLAERAGSGMAGAQPGFATHALPDSLLGADLRHRLEAVLLEAGPAETPQALKQRLAALASRHFGPDHAVRATQLLDRYVDYRVALAALKRPADFADPHALRASLDERRRLRERHFDPQEYQALFAQEEELDRFTLARLEIQRNPQLDPAQQQAALRQAESELGEDQRAARAEALVHLDLAAQTAAFEAQGTGAQERHLQRRAAYGDAAAHRLAQLDREEQDWQQRLAHFAAAQAGQASPQQLQELKERLFSAPEQLRLEGALSLQSQPGGPRAP